LRDRNLRIDGWFSTNLLGNADGKALSSPDALIAKQLSKSRCLAEILGYDPGGAPDSHCHQVHIHYYPPRGDAKEAWDNIDFTGFLGGTMQLKLNLLARDSILASPMVIDLILLTASASQRGYSGYLAELNYFFKLPLKVPTEHGVSEQHVILSQFFEHLARTHRQKSRLPSAKLTADRLKT
jgi:myo-inositol-1-phosphate synthase